MSTGSYYTIGLAVSNVNSAAFYAINPAPGLSILQGGFACYPTQNQYTSVAVYPEIAQLQLSPASYIGGSVTLQTTASTIAGSFTISPAINTDATLTLYGAGGQVLGTAVLKAGQSSVNFNWNVGSSQALSLDEAKNLGEQFLKEQ